MTTAERLRHCAAHTGLDAIVELLIEAAADLDRLAAEVDELKKELRDERKKCLQP